MVVVEFGKVGVYDHDFAKHVLADAEERGEFLSFTFVMELR